MKCYQAMAIGMAMGIEPMPDEKVSQLGREYASAAGAPALVERLRARIVELEDTLRRRNELIRTWQHDYGVLMAQLLQRDAEPPVTHLPAGYYDESHVSPERLAQIGREVDALNTSPHLDVKVHDELNATVTPLRDDDYTPEAIDRATEPEPATVTEVRQWAQDVAIDAAMAPPAPEPAATDWPALVGRLRADRGWTQQQLADQVGVARSLVGYWEQGKYKPGPELAAKLRALAASTPPVPEAAGVTSSGKLRPEPGQGWKEANAARIGVPGAWAKPETRVAEQAAQEFVDQCLVPAEGYRSTEIGQTFGTYVTAPELAAAYETWAKAHGKPIVKASPRMVGAAATRSPHLKVKKQGPVHDGSKPSCYFGVKLVLDEPRAAAPEAPEPPRPTPLTLAQQNKQAVDEVRTLMAKARTVREETIPEPAVEIPPGPDELAMKLAQLKHFGIGGVHGVSRPAAEAAVANLHPTGRDVWKWSPPEATGGPADADLDATAYQLLVKCMNGLPAEYGFDYKDDVLATAGFQAEDVEAALRHPQRVEIRPESWDREKRYPILGFYRGDVSVILGMRTPAKPRVIAAYWTSLLANDTHRVAATGGGGSKGRPGLPTNPGAAMARLRDAGCEIPEPVDEKPVTVAYKGQDLGKIATARTTGKLAVQADYQRTLRKMQAIDRREEAKAG